MRLGLLVVGSKGGEEELWQNLAYMRRRKVREKIMVKMPTTMATLGRKDTLMPTPVGSGPPDDAGCA
jgi:hypothetical protein